MKLLNEIQQKLKAPKGQRNDFGKYQYRSCEDILDEQMGRPLEAIDDLVKKAKNITNSLLKQ